MIVNRTINIKPPAIATGVNHRNGYGFVTGYENHEECIVAVEQFCPGHSDAQKSGKVDIYLPEPSPSFVTWRIMIPAMADF